MAYAFEFILCKVSVDAQFFDNSTYYLHNCVCLYLVPLLLHCFGNILKYNAAVILVSVRIFSRVRSANERTMDSKTDLKVDSATENFFFKAFHLFSFSL